MDWTGENVLSAYTALFTNMKKSLGFTGLPFDKKGFLDDRVFFAFDCTSDMEAGSPHWVPGKSGNVSLNMHWRTPLRQNIVLILCLEYEMVCTLDKFGQPEIDYAPLYHHQEK